MFAFLDDHSRLAVGYRFGFAEDTVRLAAALQPALAARGVPASVYVDNGSAYVDSWLLRACGKLGIRLIHSTPHRPQGRGKIERCFRGVRDQFLVEVADTTTEQLAEQGLSPAAALLELNALFTAWVETGLPPPGPLRDRPDTAGPLGRRLAAAGPGPAMASAQALAEAFLWSEWRTVTKTATGVAARQHLPGRTRSWSAARSSWCSPRSTSSVIEVRYRGARLRTGDAAPDQPPRPPQSPTRDHPSRHRHRRPGSPTCTWSPTPTSSRSPPRNASASTPSTPPSAPIPASRQRQLPGQLTIDTPRRRRSTLPTDAAADEPRRRGGIVHRAPARIIRDSPACRSAASLAPAMLHRHAGHAEAVARIGWCIDRAPPSA